MNIRATFGQGDIMISVLVFAAIAVTVTIGISNWGASMLKGIRTAQAREQAFQIAEAGVDYYRWHLAQYPTDYTDGTGVEPGPYYHDFYDKDGAKIGSYALTITPPAVGSTKVIIRSTATTTAYANVSRTIEATLAQPSLARFAVIADDFLRFGLNTVVYGPIFSNKGIHFDGTAYNVVSSALATTTDPDNTSCWPRPACTVQWGVFTQNGADDPKPPTPPNDRPDVFVAGRQYPVPAFPFASLTVDLSNLLGIAAPGGVCSPPSCWADSAAQGYYMRFNTDDTYDMYKVTTRRATPTNCTNSQNQSQWGTWSVGTLSSKLGTYPVPSNGVIFVKDDLWVDGTIDGTRVTVAVADIGQTDPGKYLNITINSDLRYTDYDGTDVIGLIAQNNVNIGLFSEDDIQIDAALVAQKGRVGRYSYGTNCRSGGVDYYARSNLTLNGMIATAVRYGFAYTGSNTHCSTVNNGYCERNLNYDGNLLYSPPPSFPLASTQYQTVSWREVR